jgi:adenylate kinase family enzyme
MELAVRAMPVVVSVLDPSLPTVAVNTSKSTRITLFFCLLATALGLVPGCHSRPFYRKQADQEAYALMASKASHVARPPQTPLTIQIDPTSRMFNPFDLDFQPMPLDDPASHRYMQCVDGRRGYPMWDAAGETNTTENPDWLQFLPLNEEGVLVLDADTAVRIALLQSPEYQRQREQLYLSALDVSSERFRFDTQFFGGAGSTVNMRNQGIGSTASLRDNLTMNRAFATGGDLVVGLANSIVWTLSGPSNAAAHGTLLDFTFFQPLLRGAGRDRVLERLTLAERRLLANVRAFERYRRSFYLNIVIGRNTESNVQRSGGVFGVGLGGFTGLGGGFAGLGGGGGGFATGGGVAQAGGFFGLLQDQLQIRNREENIARLAENLLVLENTLVELLTTIPDDPEEIIRQRLQVAQARSALLNAQSQLLTQQAGYQASVDAFLSDLGLPPYICVRVDDPILERFELIDRDLRSRREALVAVRTEVGQLNVSLLDETTSVVDPDTGLPQAQIEWTPSVAEKMRQLQKALEPLSDFNQTLIKDDLPRIARDIEVFDETLPEREQQSASLLELYRSERETICSLLNLKEVDESIFDTGALPELRQRLDEDYAKLEMDLNSYTQRLIDLRQTLDKFLQEGAGGKSPIELAKALRDEVILPSQDLLAELGDDVLTLQLIQARARTESVVLAEVDIDPATAFQIARKNRRDWANARASLVDSWRLIEFNADDLESGLDVTFNGSISGSSNSPFDLNSDSGNLSVGLQWDAPLTRLQERNTYRQSLIEFNQARRSYYQFEDGIWRLLRGQVRQLQLNRFNFELGRQSVRIAAAQIELNEDIRLFRDARGLSSGVTAARDTITALEALLNSQNQLLDIYVNYEVVRRGLDFDLGTMELTPEGIWIDPGSFSPEELLSLPGTSFEGMLDGSCTDCGIRLDTPPSEVIYGVSHQRSAVNNDPGEGILHEIPAEFAPTEAMPIETPIADPAHKVREL